jgi:hypothetical protein
MLDDCWDSDNCETTQYSDSSDEDVELLFSEERENKVKGSAVKSSWQVIDMDNLEKAQVGFLDAACIPVSVCWAQRLKSPRCSSLL